MGVIKPDTKYFTTLCNCYR